MNDSELQPWQLLSLREVTKFLGVSLPKVKRMVREGVIASVVFDGSPYVSPQALSDSAPGKRIIAQMEREEAAELAKEQAIREREEKRREGIVRDFWDRMMSRMDSMKDKSTGRPEPLL
jgi:hypothetical protein